MTHRSLLFQLSGCIPNAGACRDCAEGASLGVAENVTAANEVIEEGRIDEQKTLGDYAREFRDCGWAPIKVIDVMDISRCLRA